MFRDLLAEPGVEEVLTLRSTVGFLAFHGGSLERMTDVIAVDAAERSGASVYAVVQPPGLRWHIRSVDVTPDASPALRAFLDHVDVAIALHGYGRRPRPVDLLLGGGNRQLATVLAHHLRAALPGYRIVADLDAVPAEMRGLHPANPVNVPRRGGVQLELPPRVRGAWPAGAGLPCTPHPGLVAALVRTVADYGEASGESMSNVPPARQ